MAKKGLCYSITDIKKEKALYLSCKGNPQVKEYSKGVQARKTTPEITHTLHLSVALTTFMSFHYDAYSDTNFDFQCKGHKDKNPKQMTIPSLHNNQLEF